MRKYSITGLLAVALSLLWLGGCSRNSEGKVVVTNTGVVNFIVLVNYEAATIAVGGSDTLTMSWPGSDPLDVEVSYYPVGQAARIRYLSLVLNPGETRTLSLGFDS